MVEIETRIEIDAAPSRVWEILTDFAAYAAWNPFIVAIGGNLAAGGQIEARIARASARPIKFRPVLLAVEPERELRWLGTLLAPSLFAGEHSFRLEALSEGKTQVNHCERFSGLLAPWLMSGRLFDATREGFLAMNEALKRRAETQG